ncbi:hypothetical protein PHYC_02172 [Phycisphaerales bacterium]|nr:hypothetical protein PHYC_02172 [Phycisphaerales bacterium]
MNRTWATILSSTLAVSLPVAAGCVVASESGCAWQPAGYKASKPAQSVHVAGAPLDVQTENGSITVRKTDGDQVVIAAHISAISQERLDATKVTAQRSDDGTLTVRVEWPGGKREMNEGASIEILTPGAKGLNLRSSNGAIVVSGMSGHAALKSSNGSITVTEHAGHVVADTSNGSINLSEVASAHADTSNGAVTIRLAADAAGPIDADTSNGSIVLEVGDAFDASLDAKTSNAGVKCTATGATAVASGRNHGAFKFGNGTHKCRLDSSNGSITIRSR